jgi:hypothetical protein
MLSDKSMTKTGLYRNGKGGRSGAGDLTIQIFIITGLSTLVVKPAITGKT